MFRRLRPLLNVGRCPAVPPPSLRRRCIPYIRFDDLRFGPTLRPSLRRSLNPVLPHRPTVLNVHELIYGDIGQREPDRQLLFLGLAHRSAPRERQAAPAVRAVRGPVVVGRLLEGPRLLVPLAAVGSPRLQALRAANFERDSRAGNPWSRREADIAGPGRGRHIWTD